MQDEIVIYSHNDLDALGSMLNIEMALPNIKKSYWHTNYKDIDEQANDVINYLNSNNVKLLMITDISFADNKNILDRLVNTANSLNTKVIYLDHHVYPEGFFDEFKMTYVHDISKSATQITHEFFKNQGKSKNLDFLTKIIDVYDIWQTKEALFRDSIFMNDYFWGYLQEKNLPIQHLMNSIISNDYTMPSDYDSSVEARKIQSIEQIQKYRDRKLIHCDGFTTIAFVDDFYNDILFNEFKNKMEIVLIVNSYGIVRFRFNQDGILSDDTKREIKKELGCEAVGHLNAFPILVRPVSFPNIMTKIKEINAIIGKHKG